MIFKLNLHESDKKLAEKLGIGFYDKNLIDAAAEKCGIHIDVLHKADEKAANPLTNPFLHPGYEAGTVNDRLFWTQSEENPVLLLDDVQILFYVNMIMF